MKLSKQHLYEAFRECGENHSDSLALTENVFNQTLMEQSHGGLVVEAPLASKIGRAFSKHGSKIGGVVDKVRNSKIGKMAIDKVKDTKYGKQFARGAGSAARQKGGLKNALKGTLGQRVGRAIGKKFGNEKAFRKGQLDKGTAQGKNFLDKGKGMASSFGKKAKQIGRSMDPRGAAAGFKGGSKSGKDMYDRDGAFNKKDSPNPSKDPRYK